MSREFPVVVLLRSDEGPFPSQGYSFSGVEGGRRFKTSGFKSAVLTLVQSHYKISAKRFWTDASGAILGLLWGHILFLPLNILWIISFNVQEKELSHWKGEYDANNPMRGRGDRHFNVMNNIFYALF